MPAQAFRPHVMDMFEPQDHPNVIPYPGAPPTPPYDNAGWTLAFQMGVQFDRILDAFDGPFEKIADWNVKPPAGAVATMPKARAYALSRDTNDAFRAVNRLIAAGEKVSMTPSAFYFGVGAPTVARLRQVAADIGVSFEPVGLAPAPPPIRAPRIALWDQYGGSIESGWARWILEQFEFPFTRVYAPELDAGDLNARYDVLILVNGAVPASGAGSGGRGGRGGPSAGSGRAGGPDPQDVPAEYRAQIGRVTADKTIPQIKSFVEAGGTVIAIGGSAMNLAAYLRLPIESHLVENGQALPRSKYFVPGSVLSARVDTRLPIAAGMRERTDFFFDNSPVFKLGPGAAAAGIRTIAMFDTATPLHSGWAWGQKYLDGGIAALDVPMGKGRLLLYGPEILQRAQPHGTFKLLFNGLYR